jgi:hypothetical protein
MILQQVKDPYGLKEILLSKMDISHQVSLASLLGVFAGYCRRALVDEWEMIRTRCGKKTDT